VSIEPTRHRPDDLASLLERCALGDHRAFSQLYDATAARAHGLAQRVLRDPGMAEEVTQEAYLQVWRLAQRYDRRRGDGATWLLTLVHRRAVDRLRSTRASVERDDAYQRGSRTGTDFDRTADSALASLEAARVRSALATLTPPQRHAVSLAYFDGLTYAEVAAVVGVPLGTVKSRIRAGMQQLRRALAAAELEAI
jgi:RNA polymerase sigma-70 factor (ECF subfamily)